MKDDPRRERGKARMAQVSGLPAFDPPDAFTAATCDVVFGELWQRPGLPDRERRMITIAILATRGLETELGIHLRAALSSGDVDPAELMELVLQVAHYAGFPLGSVAYRAYRSACDELGLEVPSD
ncbi:MAG: carboxymuconolactone decarboxylase family protein [Myxococcota bacterium]